MNHRFTRRSAAALLCATVLVGANTWADTFPSKPITMIVPFSTGSGSDATGRYYADKMAAVLGQPVVVENRPGADGMIGMMPAKRAAPDGYTIVQGGISPSAVNVVTRENMQYDPVKDFEPIFGYAYGANGNVVLVSVDSPYKTFKDLLQFAQKSDRPMNVGTFSTTLYLSAAWLAQLGNFKMENIPYKGQAAAMTDLMGNRLDFALLDFAGSKKLVDAGKVRALAVSAEHRAKDLPDVPTVKENGLNDYVQYSWNALFVRSDTPADVKAKLANAVRSVMQNPQTMKELHGPNGTQPKAVESKDVRAMQIKEIATFQSIADKIHFKKF